MLGETEPIFVGSQNLFELYLTTRGQGTDIDPELLLEKLLIEHAQPVLIRVVRSRLGSLYSAADASELASEAMAELLGRLRTLRELPEQAESFPFEALAAGIAANTVYRFLARRFPERGRLRKQIRYVLGSNSRFATWQGTNGAVVCALAGVPAGSAGTLATAEDVDLCMEKIRRRPIPVQPLASLVLEILRGLSRPIDLSRLTNIAAELMGIREPSWISESGAEGEDIPVYPADPAPSAAMRVELHQRLEHLWQEVRMLSVRHRIALLLSARASAGAAVWLLVDLGIAAFREIAAALEISVAELSEIWNRLPLEDSEIGARLGLERQQVINLRFTAREKLERRENSKVKPISGHGRL